MHTHVDQNFKKAEKWQKQHGFTFYRNVKTDKYFAGMVGGGSEHFGFG